MKLFIEKENQKFSGAHMTVFPNGSKEPLHGHNYYVGLRLELKNSDFENLIDFSEFKTILQMLCEKWDEKVLLAIQNPFYEERISDGEIEIRLCKKRYVFPEEEVVRLDTKNISSESLAELLLTYLVRELEKKVCPFSPHRKLL